jgi:carbohydrate kinase (thermoresistant glucokinase family)
VSTTHVVVMGVSGTGKTTVAKALTEQLDAVFAEGDDLHPPANVAKMTAGTPLTDDDRWPWLRSLAAWTREQAEQGRSTVITCSALRRVYRDVLRTASARMFFVHLDAPEDVLLERMAARQHYMPPSLLRSQLDTLEGLDADEHGITLDSTRPPEQVVGEAVAAASV